MAYIAAAAVLAAVSLTLTALLAGGEACNNVGSMTRTAACQQTGQWEQRCHQILDGTTPDTAEVTVYALMASTHARFRYEYAMGDVDMLLSPGNAPPDALAELDNCKVKYGVALRRIAAVEEQLGACDFEFARQEYIDAEVAVRSCQEGLMSLPEQYHSWWLYSKVSEGHEVTMVAYLLGAIFLGS